MTVTFAQTRYGSRYTFTKPGKPDYTINVSRGVPFDLERAKANAEYVWAR